MQLSQVGFPLNMVINLCVLQKFKISFASAEIIGFSDVLYFSKCL
jgi:hypothetical protein